jgi:hypothetical protein
MYDQEQLLVLKQHYVCPICTLSLSPAQHYATGTISWTLTVQVKVLILSCVAKTEYQKAPTHNSTWTAQSAWWLCYRLDNQHISVWFLAMTKGFLLRKQPRLALWRTQLPTQQVLQAPSPAVKWLGHEADHPPPLLHDSVLYEAWGHLYLLWDLGITQAMLLKTRVF